MIRGVFLADTHLGIDWPLRPKVERRRRGDDFFANYLTALRRAVETRADFVLHGGDLFYRSRVPDQLILRAYQPLLEVAEAGIEIFLVPGNHERSRLPASVFMSHPKIHIFDRPRSFVVRAGGVVAELSGFAFRGSGIRDGFPEVVRELQRTWTHERPDVRLLCMHEIVQGARVGPSDFQFRGSSDVVRCRDIPPAYDAVLSGHIHRRQVLTHDPEGRPLPSPVYYPGSVERTSFAERDEEKGYLELELVPGVSAAWVPLPARPMVTLELDMTALGARPRPDEYIADRIAGLDRNAVVRVRLTGKPTPELLPLLSASGLRRLAPASMNIDLQPERRPERTRRGSAASSAYRVVPRHHEPEPDGDPGAKDHIDGTTN